MDKLIPILLTVGIIGLVFGGMLWGWWARSKGQATLPQPESVPNERGAVRATATGLYVATTLAGTPLERITVHGLGFRARATMTVTDLGVILALAGRDEFLLPRQSILEAGRASWAIDGAVEHGGFVVIHWLLGETELDTYLRFDGEPGEILTSLAQWTGTTS